MGWQMEWYPFPWGIPFPWGGMGLEEVGLCAHSSAPSARGRWWWGGGPCSPKEPPQSPPPKSPVTPAPQESPHPAPAGPAPPLPQAPRPPRRPRPTASRGPRRPRPTASRPPAGPAPRPWPCPTPRPRRPAPLPQAPPQVRSAGRLPPSVGRRITRCKTVLTGAAGREPVMERGPSLRFRPGPRERRGAPLAAARGTAPPALRAVPFHRRGH